MSLRNGVKFDFQKIKKDGLEIIDKNIVRHTGMNRLTPRKKTPFQDLLNTISQSQYKLNEDQFAEIIKKTISIPSLKDNAEMFSASDSDIIDAYNDSSRRFFESILGKKIMVMFLADNSSNLTVFVKEFKAFMKNQYEIHKSSYIKQWSSAQAGKKVKDENLAHYALLRNNMKLLMSENHFGNNNFLLELLDLHYLTHQLASLSAYKTYHPSGYVKSYTENSLFYTAEHRGRINGYGFNHNEPSLNLGIMRSIDKTPYDMRKPKLLSSETRCPDRLYMIHPKKARHSSKSWIHQAFSNPHNSTYVNGLSGSTLLEINSLLFFMKALQIKFYSCTNISYSELTNNNFRLIKDYILLLSGLFIYFEGGHTITEIMSVFNLPKVSSSIEIVLDQPTDSFSLKSIMLDSPLVYPLIKESLIEAAKYQAKIEQEKRVHDQIYQRKSEAIQIILNDFKQKIASYGSYYPGAKLEALELLTKLEEYKKIAFKDPSSRSINTFREKAGEAIKEALPKFQRDLELMDYLINMAKKIANILINIITFTEYKKQSFFTTMKSSEAELDVTDLEVKLQF